ncbi:MAG: His/Gly/Thr/Pro-type tRNA ligase C-terminal domain-containing protein, partial [Burkholderiales bacterium]
HAGERASRFAWQAAEAMREAGLRVVLHCGGGSFKSQMKRADASGARFAIIIGDDEAGRNVVSLKPLRQLGEQQLMNVSEAAEFVRAAG